MYKVPKYLVIAALTILTLAGCSSDDNEPIVDGRKDCPDFTATIGGAQARAFDSKWESGDVIGITGAARTNVPYSTSAGDGIFSVKTAGDQIYFQDESEVTFTAYYPWTQLTAGASTIKADSRQQASQKNFDFLWAQAKGKKEAPDVAFTFAHRMAKVVLTVNPGDGMSYDEIKTASLKLGGFKHTGSFNIATGATAVEESLASDWVFSSAATAAYDDAKKTVTFSLIFFPQVHAKPLAFSAELPATRYHLNAEIDFTQANSKTDGALAKNQWVAGRQYNLSVTLHKTDIEMGTCTIKSWNIVSMDNQDVY